jgi:ankyrin
MNTQDIYQHVKSGSLDQVREFCDARPDLIDLRNVDKEAWEEITPLHCAAKHGHLNIVRLLVERGAEVYSNPYCSYPPVMIAAWHKRQPVVDFFLNEIPDQANGTSKLGVTIHLAARQGWSDLVARHIAADPLAVHQRGWLGDTPLHWPSHNGFVPIVEMLLDAGADIEADELNCYGGKPLHWASEHEPATVELLLRRGAQIDARNVKPDSDFFGMTPLIMNAAQKNDCAAVTELLLRAGAQRDATDAKGKTALDYATERGHDKVAAVLRGAV